MLIFWYISLQEYHVCLSEIFFFFSYDCVKASEVTLDHHRTIISCMKFLNLETTLSFESVFLQLWSDETHNSDRLIFIWNVIKNIDQRMNLILGWNCRSVCHRQHGCVCFLSDWQTDLQTVGLTFRLFKHMKLFNHCRQNEKNHCQKNFNLIVYT